VPRLNSANIFWGCGRLEASVAKKPLVKGCLMYVAFDELDGGSKAWRLYTPIYCISFTVASGR
jgi:hypothetical protein